MSAEEHVLPPFSGSPRQLDVLKSAISKLRTDYRLSQETVAEKLSAYVEATRSSRKWHVQKIDQRLISKFLGRGLGRPKHPDIYEAMWEWLSSDYDELLKECDLANPRTVTLQNPIVAAIHGQLSPGRPLLAERLNQLQGRYLTYRRFFLDPERVMVAELHCGGEHDPTAFRMEMKYPGVGGQEPVDTVDGYMIPYEHGVLFQGRFAEMKGPFVVAVSNLTIDAGTNRYSRGEGAVLAGACGELPSAYGLLILRTELALPPGVYETSLLQEDRVLWSLLEPMLNRGFVSWHR